MKLITYLTLLITLIPFGLCQAESNTTLDSLRNIINTAPNDSIRFFAIDEMFFACRNTDSMLYYADMETELSKNMSLRFQRGARMRHVEYYWDIGKYEEALNIERQNIALCDSAGNKDYVASGYSSIGQTLVQLGDYTNADINFHRALDYYYQQNDSNGIATIFGELGLVYANFSLFDMAETYIKKAIEITKATHNYSFLIHLNSKLLYMSYRKCQSGDFSDSICNNMIDIAKQSIEIAKRPHDIKQTPINKEVADVVSYSYLSKSYYYKALLTDGKQRKQMLDSCLTYINIFQQHIDLHNLAYAQIDVDLCKSLYYIEASNKSKAYSLLQKIESSNAEDLNEYRSELYNNFITFALKYKNWELAYNYKCKLTEWLDRDTKDKYLVQSTQNRMQTEFDNQIRIREQAEHERALRNRYINLIFIISVVLVLIIATIIFIAYRRERAKVLILCQRLEECANCQHKISQIQSDSNNINNDKLDDNNQELTFNKIEQIIDEQKLYCDQDINRDTLARQLGTNRQYLVDCIKDATGKSFIDYVYSKRLSESVNLIMTKVELSFIEISEIVGFSSYATFYRAFVKEYGIKPADYKNYISSKVS